MTRRRTHGQVVLAGLAGVAFILVSTLGVVIALTGAGVGCLADSGAPSVGGKVREIPADRLRIYQAAGRRFDLDWAFLASIGAQECHHGSCAGDNGSGCAGPMQIAVRRGSPCSPGSGPTLWDRYGVDGNDDGDTDPDSPADAIFTAARVLREVKHAPPAGGSFAAYRTAACAYYGACSDATADYADEVMTRAVAYGFGQDRVTAGRCGGAAIVAPARRLGHTLRDRAPGGLAPLPASVTGGAPITCDRRIRADVVWLARRYRVRVTACFAIHKQGGEHPLGAAVDLVPAPGANWSETAQLAHAAGWKRSCAATGVAPDCARPPFRFVGYNGFPGHGDPAHCRCESNAHLHLSWLTSASSGEREHAERTAYFPPSWIDVLVTADTGGRRS
jgi:hypothetical protein